MKPRLLPLFAVLPLATTPLAWSQTFKTASDGGNWGTATNWTPETVPNAVDAEAILNGAGPSNTAPATSALDVLTDGVFTIGKLTRSVNASVAGTILTGTGAASMDPTKGLTLQTSGSALPQINTVGDTFFYSALFGTQGFEKIGAGRFTLRYNTINQTYSGPIRINAGTLGIEKDASLGNVENDIEIAGGARLFGEPGANSGSITLPTTRSITFTGGTGAQQIGTNAATVTMTIEGNITESAPSGLTKTDAGVLVLAGTNTWTGTTTVSGGALVLAKPASLPGYDSNGPFFTQTYSVANGTTLAVRYGDTSLWTKETIEALASGATFNTSGSLGFDTTGSTTDSVYDGDLVSAGIPRVAKIGPGKLTLANCPGLNRVTLFDGTLALDPASILDPTAVVAFNKGGALLDLGGTAATVTDIVEFNGGSSAITNGALTYAGGSLTLSGNSGTAVDLSGLSSFTYATTGSELKLENGNNVNASQNSTLFSAGTNTITASTRFLIGGGGSTSNGIHLNTARFGAVNTINTALLQLGGFNNAGLINFQSGLTDPSMKIRAANGTAAIPSLVIGETSSGTRSGAGTLDLTGGVADIAAVGITVGRHIAGASNAATSGVTVTGGTVTATNLILSEKTNGGTPANIANFTQQGTAAVDVESIGFSHFASGAAAAGQLSQSNYFLEGGTLAVTAMGGFNQLETAAANGTVSTAGNLAVTVTGADLDAPVVVNVAVNASDVPTGNGATDWTLKIANALNANPAVFAKYVATRANNAVILTRRKAGSADSTLNLAIANGTAAGITETPTSTDTVTSRNTSAGVGRNLVLRGGTLTNRSGADLTIGDVTMVVAGTTTAVVDSTPGRKVVLGSTATYSARMNSSATTAGTLQVDGDLDLSGAPAFAIFDDATGDATALAGGTKLVLIDYQDGSLAGTFAGLADGAAVNVTKGTVTNSFVIDYNDPAYGGKAVTLTIPAGSDYAAWATDKGIAGQPFDGDFDGDGLSNGVEYGLGRNPAKADPNPASWSGNTVTFTKGADAIANGDVSWVVETSTTLAPGSWIGTTQPAGDTSPTISHAFTPGNPAREFVRLRVVRK
jgi:fibronectin-binding autotransporter adhesin